MQKDPCHSMYYATKSHVKFEMKVLWNCIRLAGLFTTEIVLRETRIDIDVVCTLRNCVFSRMSRRTSIGHILGVAVLSQSRARAATTTSLVHRKRNCIQVALLRCPVFRRVSSTPFQYSSTQTCRHKHRCYIQLSITATTVSLREQGHVSETGCVDISGQLNNVYSFFAH